MVVVWSAQGQRSLDEIWDYYSQRSVVAATKIINKIKATEKILSTMPMAASIELLLEDNPRGYRKLIVGNYKVIYYVGEEAVYVALVFDTRRNPDTLRRLILN
jgi:plasmid stabilization system protein ParE